MTRLHQRRHLKDFPNTLQLDLHLFAIPEIENVLSIAVKQSIDSNKVLSGARDNRR